MLSKINLYFFFIALLSSFLYSCASQKTAQNIELETEPDYHDILYKLYSLQQKYPDTIQAVQEQIVKVLKEARNKLPIPYALNYDGTKYYMIDSTGNYVQKYRKWDRAYMVDNPCGWIHMWNRDEPEHYLDKTGKLHQVTQITELDTTTTYLSVSVMNFIKNIDKILLSTNLEFLKIEGKSNQNLYIPAEIQKLHKLKSIEIEYCQLELSDEIGSLNELGYLSMYQTNLKKLPATIGNLKKLRQLNLTSNKLKVLPSEIGNLENLEILRLSWNNLQSLPQEISKLKKLSFLDVMKSPIKVLPEGIGELKNLTFLRCDETQMQEFSIEITKLHKLKTLYINDNNISKIPKEISNLKNLEYLDIALNQISTLPPEIGALTKLNDLGAEDNLLEELPAEIGNLKNLKFLYLTGNKLKSIPDEIGNLENIEKMYIGKSPLPDLYRNDNQITSLPFSIQKLSSLKFLDIYQLSISIEEVKKLQESLPNCEIQR